MEYMFNNCNNLKSLDLVAFKTNKVKSMEKMFNECNSITSIENLNNFDTSLVTNMALRCLIIVLNYNL